VTRNAEVLPLFARLSQAEQDRIFDGHTGRRIVLATNVAETSLTVPGIRYVIDAGTARVKRYSLRSKVEQLLVEPISQAAANQRAGRCGRVANGICIRLYDEADFNGPPALYRPGNPAFLAGGRDPAHEVAAPGRCGGGLPVHRRALGPGHCRRLPAAQ
jgi:ATP-dependent helicase HrpA